MQLTRINWQQIIIELCAAGWTMRRIAAKLGVHPSSVERYKNQGTEPPHNVGEALRMLWMRVTKSR